MPGAPHQFTFLATPLWLPASIFQKIVCCYEQHVVIISCLRLSVYVTCRDTTASWT